MAQKNLKKSKSFKLVGAFKRQNVPTKKNLSGPNVSNRAIHKNSAKLGKIIETEVASQACGASGLLGNGGALSVVRVDKQVLGRIVARCGGKKGGSSVLRRK